MLRNQRVCRHSDARLPRPVCASSLQALPVLTLPPEPAQGPCPSHLEPHVHVARALRAVRLQQAQLRRAVLHMCKGVGGEQGASSCPFMQAARAAHQARCKPSHTLPRTCSAPAGDLHHLAGWYTSTHPTQRTRPPLPPAGLAARTPRQWPGARPAGPGHPPAGHNRRAHQKKAQASGLTAGGEGRTPARLAAEGPLLPGSVAESP